MSLSSFSHVSKLVMRAIVSNAGKFELAQITRPLRTHPRDVLIKVERISLNRGEISFPWAAGSAAGWDAYGIVLETSDDGDGPAVGTRVATWNFSGGWAEYRVVSRANLAAVPEAVSPELAAAIPVAGLTALRALRQLGLGSGKAVAITGCTGGVGHLLFQLAIHARHNVTAIVRGPEAKAWLIGQGVSAGMIVEPTSLGSDNSYDAIIDMVGGDTLSRLISVVRLDGVIILIGNASAQNTEISTDLIISKRIDIVTFKNYSDAGEDIAYLLELIAADIISLQVTEAGDWSLLTTYSPQELLKRGKVTFSIG